MSEGETMKPIDYIIIALAAAVVVGVTAHSIWKKKKGQGGCGCGCSGCPHAGACSSVPTKREPSENKAN